jgi:endonuclease/exonuclease/phosphatase family metal-dependent hydrolase
MVRSHIRFIAVLGAALFALVGCGSALKHETASLRVMSYNIKHGYGNDGVIDLERAAAVIEAAAPDVVALQEVDERCRRSGDVDQAAWLGERLGMTPIFGSFMDYDGGRYGMALLSTLPIIGWENHILPPGAEPRCALAARVQLADGSNVVVVGIHLYATEQQRLAQANAVLDLFADEAAPVILAGDFNSRPDSPVMELLWRHWANPVKGADRYTFHASDPSREIDYILYHPAERFEVMRMDVFDEPLASDHRPLILELRMRTPVATEN